MNFNECLFCGKRTLRNKKLSSGFDVVCLEHLVVACSECGSRAYWMDGKDAGYVCFNVDCSWRSKELPVLGELFEF